MIRGYTREQLADQTGRCFLVTGANTGIGLEVARALAEQGARVLLACRSAERAAGAIADIRAGHPDADVVHLPLDLADLGSVREAAARALSEPRLDVLINNAGVLAPPLTRTADGFELQFGVNHLGPFALTGLLLPRLMQTPGARVVNTSSSGHRQGKLDFGDLNAHQRYSRWGGYASSKLANLLHTYELDRRLRARGSALLSVAAHPGGADTEVVRYVPKWMIWLTAPVGRLFINTAAQGAWPTLLAATHPEVEGGRYFGPSRWGEMSGPAQEVDSSPASKDPETARRLWEASVELTGVDPGV